jgi:hypothetical protein
MTTRYSNNKRGFSEKIDSGYEKDIAEGFSMPSCTIEDVDRAVFELFDKELPFFFFRKDAKKKVPVIFATGERFAILARNKPLRDKSDALILPLISIVRTGIDQEGAKGTGLFQGAPVLVKVQLSDEDPIYQRLQNKLGFKNSDDTAISAEPSTTAGLGGASSPGRVATRRPGAPITVSARQGTVLQPTLSKNIFEFIEIPPIKQYTASYEVTFWAQYTQEMNSMLTVMMNGYIENRRRTYVVTTKEGYQFTAYVDASLSPQNNFDDFTESERLVKYNFSMTVSAYLVAAQEPGAPVPFRKTVSAPEITFDVSSAATGGPSTSPVAGTVSGDPKDYILDDILTDEDGYPPAMMGSDPSSLISGFPGNPTFSIGGKQSDLGNSGPTAIFTDINPFTGKRERRILLMSVSTPNKGETVFRFGLKGPEGIAIDLGKLLKD